MVWSPERPPLPGPLGTFLRALGILTFVVMGDSTGGQYYNGLIESSLRVGAECTGRLDARDILPKLAQQTGWTLTGKLGEAARCDRVLFIWIKPYPHNWQWQSSSKSGAARANPLAAIAHGAQDECCDAVSFSTGLHVHSRETFQHQVRLAMSLLARFRRHATSRRVAIFREVVAAHFEGTNRTVSTGDYLDRRRNAVACAKQATTTQGWRNEIIAAEASRYQGLILVEQLWRLTAPRYDLHPGDQLWRAQARRLGFLWPLHFWWKRRVWGHELWQRLTRGIDTRGLLDCTHLCFSPLFWSAVTTELMIALDKHLRERRPMPPLHGNHVHAWRKRRQHSSTNTSSPARLQPVRGVRKDAPVA